MLLQQLQPSVAEWLSAASHLLLTPSYLPRGPHFPPVWQVLEQLGVQGVLILEVPAGTPAAAAGLRPTYRDVFGDIVLGDIVVGTYS